MRPFLFPSVAFCTLALVLPACTNTSPVVLAPRATATPTAIGATSTPTPVATATPAATATPTPITTATPTPVATATPTPIATATPTPIATATPTPIATATPTLIPTATPVPSPTATAQPQVIYMSFNYVNATDPAGDAIADYSSVAGASAPNAFTFVHGSQVVFTNTDSTVHNASGLGTSGFPVDGTGHNAYDNTSGSTKTGTVIDGGLTWSSGSQGAGTSSAAFTVGPPAKYYFGCSYHYNSSMMQDTITST